MASDIFFKTFSDSFSMTLVLLFFDNIICLPIEFYSAKLEISYLRSRVSYGLAWSAVRSGSRYPSSS